MQAGGPWSWPRCYSHPWAVLAERPLGWTAGSVYTEILRPGLRPSTAQGGSHPRFLHCVPKAIKDDLTGQGCGSVVERGPSSCEALAPSQTCRISKNDRDPLWPWPEPSRERQRSWARSSEGRTEGRQAGCARQGLRRGPALRPQLREFWAMVFCLGHDCWLASWATWVSIVTRGNKLYLSHIGLWHCHRGATGGEGVQDRCPGPLSRELGIPRGQTIAQVRGQPRALVPGR